MMASQLLALRVAPLARSVVLVNTVAEWIMVRTMRSAAAAAAASRRRRREPSQLFLLHSSPQQQKQPSLRCQSYCSSSAHRQEYGSVGTLPSMTLYNSLTDRVEPLMPSLNDDDDAAAAAATTTRTKTKGMACYTCGPTVYAPAHMGHARTYVWLDILRRCLEQQHQATAAADAFLPPPPLFVVNITDVDDKILNAAAASAATARGAGGGLEETPLMLARRYEAEFWEDWDALHCLRPHVVMRVTEHVESDIVPYIQRLLDHGMAYQIDKSSSNHHNGENDEYGGIYFDVRAFEERTGALTRYGKLAPPSVATDVYSRQPPPQQEGEKQQQQQQQQQQAEKGNKRDARDFALWKKRKNSELMFWNSPWGMGRPGWHIECSAMIEAVAKQFQETHTFVIHAGGIDLKFPHHTNEIAQAEAYRLSNNDESSSVAAGPSEEWIRHWIHTGHLHIDGLKMSKSLKNFVSIKDFLADGQVAAGVGQTSSLASPADDFRLWCLGLSGPYRGNATFSKERIHESRNVRVKIVRFLLAGEEWLLRRREEEAIAAGTESGAASKKWRNEDCDLFARVNDAVAKSRKALLSDLDGSTYVEQMVRISEDGRSYLDQEATAKGPTEPISAALQALRDLLSLVGFSDATCRAGMASLVTSTDKSNDADSERALINELARFRSAVRRAAIDDHKDKDITPSDNMKKILNLCDEARDKVFPVLGVEFMDGTVTKDGDSKQPDDDWRFCVPRMEAVSKSAAVATNSKIRRAIKSGNTQPVPPDVLFKIPPYEGLFSEYNEDGFPLLNADGSDISNTQLKKLRKTFVKHIKELDKRRKTKERLRAKKVVNEGKQLGGGGFSPTIDKKSP